MQFDSKELEQLTLQEVSSIHLGANSPVLTKSHLVISTLGVIIGEMQHASSFKRSSIFVPLLCAFAILDQIGSCYRDQGKTQPPPNASGIKKALHNFCGLNYDGAEVSGLYAFRNGLMHDASFTSCDRNGNWYYFRLKADINTVIRPAVRQWKGLANDFCEETTTYINGEMLQGIAQGVVFNLATALSSKPSSVEILASKEDLIHKYLLWKKR